MGMTLCSLPPAVMLAPGPVSSGRSSAAVTVTEARRRQDRRAWIEWPLHHYAGDPVWVPPLLADDRSLFSRKNPVHRVAASRLFLARRGRRIVGRICGIVHREEEDRLGYRRGRFGWFESVNDPAVGHALLDAVRAWLVEQGCTEMTGPHGFTDLDPEGLLIEGFHEVPTIAASYHPPYYRELVESYGLERVEDYLEYRVQVPSEDPPLFKRLRAREARSPYRVFTCRSRKEMLGYAPGFWAAVEETFASLYGVTPLSHAQQEYYTRRYLGMIDPEFIHFAVTADDEVVGFFITMPNLSDAFRRARGRLLPAGWFHIWRGIRSCHTLDLLLAGVRAGHPSPLITGLLALRVVDMCRRRGIRTVETNHELESNTSVVSIWSHFDSRMHRRSRLYRLSLAHLPPALHHGSSAVGP
jgi:hypothetical protein